MTGRYPIIDQSQQFIAGFSDEEVLVYRGDLPVVVFGDHTRVFKYIDFPFICGADGTKVLVPNKETVDPQFLYFALSALDIPSKGYNRHYKLLRETNLSLPRLPEQRRIAHILSAIQRAIQAQDAVIAAARELKRSLMHRLFTYGPYAEPLPTKETEIGEVPEGWEIVTLEQVIDIQSGQVDPRKSPYLDMLHVGPEDVEEATGRILSPRTARELGLKSGKYLFSSGEVVYSKIRPYLRKAVVPSFEGICSADMYAIRPKNDQLDTRFLHQILMSDGFTKQAVAHQARTGIPKINRVQLLSLRTALPTLAEQVSIGRNLTIMDKKITVELGRLATLEALFKSMLHQLMTGQVRVPVADFGSRRLQ